ncbi:unnamed protein product [Penicillium nalgiovense]|uniref:RING-type domain-containing protein n=1 Tax=Penicillium nalgiovense TaxID=60175 RepID=A0A9W4HPC7_PENNA|nr:unnamed protein product [Penicillium nalgiovense]CAG8001454.1 unnamed protein product [Penicillium nalgiovense]CAG8004145.1 unnamed protein product [Penicillium nalgiovense]CAG8036395.1 unnamed protein product [Penicillium nalgiovense]CAG8050327.1 unnamed protein product [Penicillium nalgiovense]
MATRNGSGAEASGVSPFLPLIEVTESYRLTRTLQLVNTLQGHVDDIRTLIQCGICIRPLYEPFTIACGHTFCYSCLSSWFAGGRSKRTCPDCRAPVKTQPAPAYLVRAVVQMFTGRAELLDKGETTTEHTKNQREEAERLDQDKANNHPTEGGLFGGLFKPKAPPLKPVIDIDDGVVRCPVCSWELEGDNCAGCGYRYRPESEETDDSESADYSETDLDSLDDGMDEEEGEGEGELGESDHFDDIEDRDGVWGNFALQYYGPTFNRRPNWPPGPDRQAFDRLIRGSPMIPLGAVPPVDHGNYLASGNTNGSEYDEEEDGDEEENEYDESDSFIDTENDHPPISSFIESQADRLGSGDMYESESDRSTGTVVDYAEHDRLANTFHYRNTTPYFDDEASEEDDEVEEEEEEGVSEVSDNRGMVDEGSEESDEDAIQTAPPRQANPQYPHRSPWFQTTNAAPWLAARPPPEPIPDSSEEEESSPPIRPARSSVRRHVHHGTTALNAIPLDDSDDDQPVGPVRRTTQRRRARFSPY